MILKASSVFFASVAVAAGVPITMAILGIGLPEQPEVGYYSGQQSSILDPAGDANAVLQNSNASIVPEIKGYHDVLAANVRKSGEYFALRIDLSGNPNLNEKFETNYQWHLIPSDLFSEEHYYLVMIINFAPDFNHTLQGWYYAIFDRTLDRYVVPLTELPQQMPNDRVEYNLHKSLIGDPSSFEYWVSVYTRVDSSSFDGPPEYLMDHAP